LDELDQGITLGVCLSRCVEALQDRGSHGQDIAPATLPALGSAGWWSVIVP
jgi:hypothetical protein